MSGISNNYNNLNLKLNSSVKKAEEKKEEEKPVVEEKKVEEKKAEEKPQNLDLSPSTIYGKALIKSAKLLSSEVSKEPTENSDIEPNNPVEKATYTYWEWENGAYTMKKSWSDGIDDGRLIELRAGGGPDDNYSGPIPG